METYSSFTPMTPRTIKKKDYDKMFMPFKQIDSQLSRQYSGRGLGLSIVKELVELHRVTVTVESKPGRGSTFSFAISSRLDSKFT